MKPPEILIEDCLLFNWEEISNWALQNSKAWKDINYGFPQIPDVEKLKILAAVLFHEQHDLREKYHSSLSKRED